MRIFVHFVAIADALRSRSGSGAAAISGERRSKPARRADFRGTGGGDPPLAPALLE